MVTRRRIVRSASPAATRPRYTWRAWDGLLGFTLLAGVQTRSDLSSSPGWPTLDELGVFGDYTIRRIRGVLVAQSLDTSEELTAQSLHVGIIVLEDDALAAGASPDVRTDAADWMFWGVVFMSAQGSFSAAVHPLSQLVIDNKSMRKVNENHQSLVMVLEAGAANTSGIQVQTAGRFLVSHGRG